MFKSRALLGAIGIAFVVIALIYAGGNLFKHGGRNQVSQLQNNSLSLTSSAFSNNGTIPREFSCKGRNVNPPLSISGVPASAKSLTLIMHDPDAPNGDFVHWLVWDIPATTEKVNTDSSPVGATLGTNGTGRTGYLGPCPPSGTHRYIFELYAVDKILGLKPGANHSQLGAALAGHILAQHNLIGTFSAD